MNGEEVDALLQVGFNFHCGKIAAEMAIELGKPALAINMCTLWLAYRNHRIDGRIEGWSGLLEKFSALNSI